LLETYNAERVHGSDENILNSARATKFMTPSDGAERLFRDQVLALAAKAPFARAWVNSGRLSVPAVYPLDAPDHHALPKASRPGAVAPDARLGNDWLLHQLGGRPVILALGCDIAVDGADVLSPPVSEILKQRYLGLLESAIYLIRPDQVIAARWNHTEPEAISNAIKAMWCAA